jgi:hypothetical protein
VHANTAVSSGDGGNGVGGGLFVSAGTVTLSGSSSVTGNIAGAGGGIANSSTVTMEDTSSVRGNTAANDDPDQLSEGGGIWSSGTVVMEDSSSVTRNHATGDGGGVYNNASIFTVNDSAAVHGNATDVGEDDVGGDVFGTTRAEWLGAAVALIWILAAIVAAFIGGPWVRAAALATFTGLIGQGPGVMVGALLGAAIIRLAGYRTESRKTWLTRWPTTNFLLAALLVSAVLVSNDQPSSAIGDLVEVVELIPISGGRVLPLALLFVLPLLLVLLIGVAAAGTAHAASAGPRTRHRSRSIRARVDHGNT